MLKRGYRKQKHSGDILSRISKQASFNRLAFCICIWLMFSLLIHLPFTSSTDLAHRFHLLSPLESDPKLPGFSLNGEFFFIGAMIDVKNKFVRLSYLHPMITRDEWNFETSREYHIIFEEKSKGQRIEEKPWSKSVEMVKVDRGCKNGKWLGLSLAKDVNVCLNHIRKRTECNQDLFAWAYTDRNCLCILDEECNEYDHPFVSLYKPIYDDIWECYLPGFDLAAQAEFLPIDSNHDPHSSNVVGNLLCHFRALGELVSEETYLQVILRRRRAEPVASIFIPTSIQMTGLFAPPVLPITQHRNPEFPLLSNHLISNRSFPDIFLCVTGIFGKKLFYFVLEFVIHHLNIGIAHIFLGYSGSIENFRTLSRILRYFIQRGFLSLISTKSSHWKTKPESKHEEVKPLFYNECLFYSKRRGDLMMISDLDEFLTPMKPKLIPDILESFFKGNNTSLKDICALTFLSVSPSGDDNSFSESKGFLSDRFPKMYDEINEIWQKSMSYSPNVFMAGLHAPAACTISGLGNPVAPGLSEGAIIVPTDLIIIHHFRDAFKTRFELNLSKVKHEYGEYWGQLVKKHVCWFLKMDHPSHEWYVNLTGMEYDCAAIQSEAPVWVVL